MCCVPSTRRLVASQHRAQRQKLNHLRNLLLSPHPHSDISSSQLQSSSAPRSSIAGSTVITTSARRYGHQQVQHAEDNDEASISVVDDAFNKTVRKIDGGLVSNDARSASVAINFKTHSKKNEIFIKETKHNPCIPGDDEATITTTTVVSSDKKREDTCKHRSRRVPSAAEKEQIAKKERELANKGPCPEAPLGYTASGKKRRKRIRKKLKPGFTAKHNERLFVKHNYHDHAKDDPTHYLLLAAQAAEAEEKKKHVTSCATGTSTVCSGSTNGESHPLKLCGGPGNNGGVSTPFPFKLHDMLDQIEADGFAHVVSWQPHGRAFVIHDKKTFVSDIMPRYFNQTKLTSFQRQLNLYGYLRLCQSGPDKGGYYHELFLRHMPFLCHTMTRVKNKGVGFKAANDPDSEPNFYSMDYVAHPKDYWTPCKAKVAALMKDPSTKKDNIATIGVVSFTKKSLNQKKGSGVSNYIKKQPTDVPRAVERTTSEHYKEVNVVSSDGCSSASSCSAGENGNELGWNKSKQSKTDEEGQDDDDLLAAWFKRNDELAVAPHTAAPTSNNIFRYREDEVPVFQGVPPPLPNVNSLQSTTELKALSPRVPSLPVHDIPPLSPLSYSGSSFDGGNIPASAAFTPASMYDNIRKDCVSEVPVTRIEPLIPMTIDCHAPSFSPILGNPSWTHPTPPPLPQPKVHTCRINDFEGAETEAEDHFTKVKFVPTFESFVNEKIEYDSTQNNGTCENEFPYEYDPAMLEPVPLTTSEMADVASVKTSESSLLEAAAVFTDVNKLDGITNIEKINNVEVMENLMIPSLLDSFAHESEMWKAPSPVESVQRMVTDYSLMGTTGTNARFDGMYNGSIDNGCGVHAVTNDPVGDSYDDDIIMQTVLNEDPTSPSLQGTHVSSLDDDDALGEFLDNLILMED